MNSVRVLRCTVLLQQHKRRQQLAEFIGQLGKAKSEFFNARPLAGSESGYERLGNLINHVAVGRGWIAHVE
jgi:hypothetical protein